MHGRTQIVKLFDQRPYRPTRIERDVQAIEVRTVQRQVLIM